MYLPMSLRFSEVIGQHVNLSLVLQGQIRCDFPRLMPILERQMSTFYSTLGARGVGE